MTDVFFCFTFVNMAITAQSIGRKRNLLHRYRLVMEEFERHYNPDIPITVIYRKHIYPKFGISRDTLYAIFNTDFEAEKAKIEAAKAKVYGGSLFD